jgi:hypothetical protein
MITTLSQKSWIALRRIDGHDCIAGVSSGYVVLRKSAKSVWQVHQDIILTSHDICGKRFYELGEPEAAHRAFDGIDHLPPHFDFTKLVGHMTTGRVHTQDQYVKCRDPNQLVLKWHLETVVDKANPH